MFTFPGVGHSIWRNKSIMYVYVKAICLARTAGSQWTEQNIVNHVVFSIYDTFAKVYIELSHPALTQNIYVDLDSLRFEFSSYSGTLLDLLTLIDNRTLETVPNLPSTGIKYVKYSDAIQSQYKIDICKIGINLPYNYPDEDRPDLVLTRPKFKTDLSLIHSHCLVTVNGYAHMTDTDGEKAYVVDGGKTLQHARMNKLGILSFLDIGRLNKVKIDPANIASQSATSSLYSKTYFSVNADLTKKTCILILGGYIVMLEQGVFWQTNSNTFALDWTKLPYVERIFESERYLNLSELGLTKDINNPNLYSLPEIVSDAVIKKYMTMSQSFMVVVDKEYLLTKKIAIKHSNLPGMFITYQDPTYPLFVGHGKIAEYWKTHEGTDQKWLLTVADSYYENFIISQQASTNLNLISNNQVPYKGFYNSRGNMLEISGYSL
jgi:hypothetical protein